MVVAEKQHMESAIKDSIDEEQLQNEGYSLHMDYVPLIIFKDEYSESSHSHTWARVYKTENDLYGKADYKVFFKSSGGDWLSKCHRGYTKGQISTPSLGVKTHK